MSKTTKIKSGGHPDYSHSLYPNGREVIKVGYTTVSRLSPVDALILYLLAKNSLPEGIASKIPASELQLRKNQAAIYAASMEFATWVAPTRLPCGKIGTEIKKSLERLTNQIELKIALCDVEMIENYPELASHTEPMKVRASEEAGKYKGNIKSPSQKLPVEPDGRINGLIKKLIHELAAKNRPDLTKAAMYIQSHVMQSNASFNSGQNSGL